MSTRAKDLTKEAPASPAQRVGGYFILARLADKTRAEFLGGTVGEYHTDCPLDHMLLDWKGIPYEDVKSEIVKGADDEALAAYLHAGKIEVEPWLGDELVGGTHFFLRGVLVLGPQADLHFGFMVLLVIHAAGAAEQTVSGFWHGCFPPLDGCRARA